MKKTKSRSVLPHSIFGATDLASSFCSKSNSAVDIVLMSSKSLFICAHILLQMSCCILVV